MNPALDREKIFYNAAFSALRGDYRKLQKLKSDLSSWEEVFESTRSIERNVNPEEEWEKLKKCGAELVFSDEPEFPRLLREIYFAPFGIYVKGNPGIFEKTSVSVVGTRKATDDGLETAGKFGRDFGRAGIVVASGLAFGIDSAAHKGCVSAGGKTAAVLACGVDEVYPKTNERLAKEILASGGAIISEYPVGTPPLPHRFIERNRIVSGLSVGVVIIEAPESSGSLATARFASEQNREAFVVPGPAGHRNFSGSHRLIRNGARLVSNAGDVLEDLGIVEPPPTLAETEEEKTILEILENSKSPLEVDKISEMSNLESRVVNETITILLFKNLVKEEKNGYITNKF